MSTTTTSINSTQTTARALVVKTCIQADITTAKVASTSEAARQKKTKPRKGRRSNSSSNELGEWRGGHEKKGTKTVAESTVTIEEVKENDTEGTVDVPFNAWRLLQDQKHAAKDGAEAMDTAEHISVHSADVDEAGNADDDDDEAYATVEDLVTLYKQSPDAEITAELYESLSYSWQARSDVDPVLGTIGYAKRKGGTAAERQWFKRGKSTRGGSAI